MKTVRYIYRCRDKKCCAIWSHEYTDKEDGFLPARTDSAPDGTRPSPQIDATRGCPRCGGRSVLAKKVKGEFNPNVECDGRCTHATGADCSCSCGGMNHGRGHTLAMEKVMA